MENMEKEILGIFLIREGDRMMFSLLNEKKKCPNTLSRSISALKWVFNLLIG